MCHCAKQHEKLYYSVHYALKKFTALFRVEYLTNVIITNFWVSGLIMGSYFMYAVYYRSKMDP